jgi:glycine/serine hydroxymethyltransferase
MKEEQMEEIAHLISDVLRSPSDLAARKKTKAAAKKLCANFPIYSGVKR